jgi:hypothetical protein
VRAREQKIGQRERLEQYSEEYRLHDQQGLSPPLVSAYLSSDEEERSDGGRATPDRCNSPPLSPRAEEAVVELVPAAGVEAPAAGPSVEASAGAAGAPAGVTEVPPQPSRKRKRGFSNLR